MTNYLSEGKVPYFISKLYGNIPVASHDEVQGFYDQYVTDALYPPWPIDIHVYLYDGDTLYFTHKEISDHKGRTLTAEYIVKPTDSYGYYDAPWNNYRTAIQRIESDKITAPASLKYFFYNCQTLTDIDALVNWNTSFVTEMNGLFQTCLALTDIDALAGWKTSAVTDMSDILANCRSLTNIDALAGWDTSHVTNMYGVFSDCRALVNIDVLAGWNTSATTSMNSTFYYCEALTDIDALANWDTSAVENMSNMFNYCQGITTFKPIDSWDVSKVTSHTNTFRNTTGTRPTWGTNW